LLKNIPYAHCPCIPKGTNPFFDIGREQ